MKTLSVSARDVRVPGDVRDALDRWQAVCVEWHNSPRWVLMHAELFALFSPLLERWSQGRPIPIESLLTDDDFAAIAEDRAEDVGLAGGILESWSA